MTLVKLFWHKRWLWVVLLARQLIKRYRSRRRHRATGLVDQTLINSLPRSVKTLGGRPMEPINLVFIGDAAKLEAAFTAAGWLRSDPPSPINLGRALVAGVLNWPYARGPITPCQVDGQLQDLAFQKPTAGNRMRRRHHIRLWRLPAGSVRGRVAWMASGSYDQGIRLTWLPMFVTHRIAPDLDQERDFIARDLGEVGGQEIGRFAKSSPVVGRNAFGDKYRTDGYVTVVDISRIPLTSTN